MATGKKDHKAFNIDFSAPSPTEANGEVHARKKKTETAPGMMADVLMAESSAIKENKDLKTRLEGFDGALPTRKIDPTSIVRSKWANRHEQSFLDKDFRELKSEIESAGGNVQAIKVRPLAGQDGKYEVVFGHRRHQACLELGFNVLAFVEELSDADLFVQMDRENRQRADLRPYEQGVMYMNALRAGLFPSNRKMAEALSVDLSNLGKYISIAELPKPILDAFPSPLDVQLGWATKLKQLLEKDADLLLVRAKEINKDPKRNAKQVMEFLQSGGVVSNHPPAKVVVEGKRGQTGMIRFNPIKNMFAIELAGIDRDRIGELEKLVKSFLGR
jgi:ParB family chromosome partitioning protein